MTPLLELAERVERLEKLDGRLNAELTCALIFTDLRPAEPNDFDGKYGYSEGSIKTQHGFLMARNLTGSVDEVLALIAEKLPGWHVNELHQHSDADDWSADLVIRIMPEDLENWFSPATAKTPALALLAAALRAIAANTPPASDGAGNGTASTTDGGRASGIPPEPSPKPTAEQSQ